MFLFADRFGGGGVVAVHCGAEAIDGQVGQFFGDSVEALTEAGGRLSKLDADLAAPTSTLESIAAADVDIPEAPGSQAGTTAPTMAQAAGSARVDSGHWAGAGSGSGSGSS